MEHYIILYECSCSDNFFNNIILFPKKMGVQLATPAFNTFHPLSQGKNLLIGEHICHTKSLKSMQILEFTIISPSMFANLIKHFRKPLGIFIMY